MWKEALTDAQCLSLLRSRVRTIMVSERHSLLHLITRGKKQPDEIRSLSRMLPRVAIADRLASRSAESDEPFLDEAGHLRGAR